MDHKGHWMTLCDIVIQVLVKINLLYISLLLMLFLIVNKKKSMELSGVGKTQKMKPASEKKGKKYYWNGNEITLQCLCLHGYISP